MESNMQNIDDLFREELGGYTEAPPPPVWEALEQRLDGKDRKRVFPFRWFWYFSIISFIVMLGAAVAWRTTVNHVAAPAIAGGSDSHTTPMQAAVPAAPATKDKKTAKPSRPGHKHSKTNKTNTAAIATTTSDIAANTTKNNTDNRLDAGSQPGTSLGDQYTANEENANNEPQLARPVEVVPHYEYVVNKTRKHNLIAADMSPVIPEARKEQKAVASSNELPVAANEANSADATRPVEQHKVTAIPAGNKTEQMNAIVATTAPVSKEKKPAVVKTVYEDQQLAATVATKNKKDAGKLVSPAIVSAKSSINPAGRESRPVRKEAKQQVTAIASSTRQDSKANKPSAVLSSKVGSDFVATPSHEHGSPAVAVTQPSAHKKLSSKKHENTIAKNVAPGTSLAANPRPSKQSIASPRPNAAGTQQASKQQNGNSMQLSAVPTIAVDRTINSKRKSRSIAAVPEATKKNNSKDETRCSTPIAAVTKPAGLPTLAGNVVKNTVRPSQRRASTSLKTGGLASSVGAKNKSAYASTQSATNEETIQAEKEKPVEPADTRAIPATQPGKVARHAVLSANPDIHKRTAATKHTDQKQKNIRIAPLAEPATKTTIDETDDIPSVIQPSIAKRNSKKRAATSISATSAYATAVSGTSKQRPVKTVKKLVKQPSQKAVVATVTKPQHAPAQAAKNSKQPKAIPQALAATATTSHARIGAANQGLMEEEPSLLPVMQAASTAAKEDGKPAIKDSATVSAKPIADTAVSPADSSSPASAMKRFAYGIKGGYESSFKQAGADKLVVAPYLEYKLTSRLSLMLQPAIKTSNLRNHVIGSNNYYKVQSGSESYTIVDSSLVYLVFTGDSLWNRNYSYHEKHDSIIKSYSVGGTYAEFELPLLLKYNITKKLSVYGGLNLGYSKLISIKEQTNTISDVSAFGSVTTMSRVNDPAPVVNSSTYPVVLNYSGSPLSSYNGPVYPSQQGSILRLGYMLGFSYEFKKRWMLDALVQQAKTKSYMQGGYNVNSALSLPYFRLTLGYRLSK